MPIESLSSKPKGKENKKLLEIYSAILNENNHKKSDKFLMQLMITKIEQIKRKTKKANGIKNGLRIAIMILAGVSTIFLGLKLDAIEPDDLSNLVLVITATITFLSGLAIFWDIENYWIRTKVMLNRLKQLRYNFTFYLIDLPDSNIKESKSREFLAEFLEIIGDDYWEKLLKTGYDSKRDTSKYYEKPSENDENKDSINSFD